MFGPNSYSFPSFQIGALGLWFLANFITFFYVFRYYVHSPETFYVYHLLGSSIAFSRASAACLNLNMAIVLLPVCRQVQTTFRFGSFSL